MPNLVKNPSFNQSIVGPLSLVLFAVLFSLANILLSTVQPTARHAMNSKEIGKHRLSPAAYWFLIQLDAKGPTKIADLVELRVFSLHAIHEGARSALELGLCAKDSTTYYLPESAKEAETEVPKENQQSFRESTNENRQIVDFEKNSSRVLSLSVAKPLKDKDLKTNSVVLYPKSDDVKRVENEEIAQNDKSEKKGEKYEEDLFFEYGQNVLKLQTNTIRTLLTLTKTQDKFITIIDAYRWLHCEAAGLPIGNVIAWANTALRNGINKQPPEQFTFASWAHGRQYAKQVAADKAALQAERDRDAKLRAEAQAAWAALTPEQQADYHTQKAAWVAEGENQRKPGGYAGPEEIADYQAWRKDWSERMPVAGKPARPRATLPNAAPKPLAATQAAAEAAKRAAAEARAARIASANTVREIRDLLASATTEAEYNELQRRLSALEAAASGA